MISLSDMIIFILHILFFLFVVSVPFTNSNYLSLLHIIIVPFVIFHWFLEDHTCSIVFVENKLNKYIFNTCDDYKGFFAKLIEPVYDFKLDNKKHSLSIYTITSILWLITSSKLYLKYKNGEINKMDDLFIS